MKKLLYVIDDINYESGAKKVTEYQMKLLSDRYDITVFCLREPKDEIRRRLPEIHFIGQEIWNSTEIFAYSFLEVMKSKRFSYQQKLMRIKYTIHMRLKKDSNIFNLYLDSKMQTNLNSFDTVIVLSEASKLRKLVAELDKPKKIQWIHTDYALWSEFSEWTKSVTCQDRELYQNFDYIVTLSEKIRNGFIAKLPSLKEKTVVIPNLIPVEEIQRRSMEAPGLQLDQAMMNIVTVGRVDKEKAYDRIVRIGKRLRYDGIPFRWYIIGDGPLLKSLDANIHIEGLSENILLLGRRDNPYPIMKGCDLFALLSEYEGMPVTIQEALILGTPVIATDVGGISDQIENGRTGILVNNTEEDIYSALVKLLRNKSLIQEYKENLQAYHYDYRNIIELLHNII